MSLNIKDKETHLLVRELAELKGETMTAAVKNSVKEDGIDNQWNCEGDDVEDIEPANAEPKRRQGSQKKGRADLHRGFAGCENPGVGAILKIPASELVKQGHSDNGEEEAQKPEQGPGVAEAQIEIPECRQQ